MHPRIVLIVQEGLDAERFFAPAYDGPLAPFLPRAATALLNPAVPRPPTPAGVYLTLGAGRRLRGDDSAGLPILATERVEGDAVPEVYRRRTGLDPGEAAALHLGIAPLRERSGERIGTLADAFRSAGRSLGLLSFLPRAQSGQTTGMLLPPTSLAVMDSHGRIDRAEVARGGISPTDAAAHCLRLAQRCDALVVALAAGSLSEEPDDAFGERLVAALLPRLDLPRDSLLFCSPVPHPLSGAAATRWDRIPPLLAWGAGFTPGRLLSATTRTAGLVANVDIAPTLLALRGVPLPSDLDGHPMAATTPSLPAVLRLARLVHVHQMIQIPLYVGFGTFATLALIVSVVALRRRWNGAALRFAAGLALLATSVPTALLLVPLVGPATPSLYLLSLVLATLAAAATAAALSRWFGPPIRAAFVLLAVLLGGDLFIGGTAVARSILSDFPMTGMRFYGIGNEYMALAVAGLIVATGWSTQRGGAGRAPGLLVVGLLTVVILGHPALGANFGGALTAAAGFAVAWMVAAQVRLDARRLGMLAGGLVVLAMALLALDALRLEAARSHMGDLGHRMATEGPAVLLVVAGRKLGMNWGILVSPWFLFSLAVVVFASALCYHGFGAAVRARLSARRDLRSTVAGILATGLVGLLAKDSGVVVAAYVACVLFALVVAVALEDAGHRGEEGS